MIRTNVVLIGGSGLGPWAWTRVTPFLESSGIDVTLPQLRATGDDRSAPSGLALTDWVDDARAAIQTSPAETVLVAHSFAGYIVAALLERHPGIARSAIFLDAALPSPNRSWFEAMGLDTEAFMTSIAVDGAIPFFTMDQLDQVYPGHGLVADDWNWMSARLTPQPIGTYRQAAISRAMDGTATVLAYVCCTRTTPPAADVSASTPGWNYRELVSGHWPMVTEPAATAAVIEELAVRLVA